MIPPQWLWEFRDVTGTVLPEPTSPVFTNQYDAEQWLGQTWRELAAAGVADAVVLHSGVPAAPAVQLSTTLA
ncbi:hypothetical protein SAMN05216410_2631 [Sanguibacter gelidistatuariae]|uniref:Uncharacterized protein n=1 Tax=Sanguibacter gelidistatuariae TaxID=1814289 RepID=A0A1G6RAM1_9MICO|nr:hypothetical protein [Sanguibacter gelidistatuariae]SDD01135.1 hypothetical protein SAMN05216410_2631 [Sanguibacter gelidistatuariae]